ncbi:NUDIX hydrolase [Clostridium sp. UBA4548]|uniref:NUDIX hydrolase n=1 Tax=Clostridium sp. UBA4548 TaxID=1946361 RepID=UPI0025BABAA3|nr:NUDIX pyrophosphatase [Clostridium sp. UBA4548]
MRAPYQVLVFPYYISANGIEYAIFRRSDANWWQAISGGGEDGETVSEAAKREAWEEGGISKESQYLKLDTVSSIPAEQFKDSVNWDKSIYVIPEYCYGVRVIDKHLTLSKEHTEYKWMTYEEAILYVKWDGNKVALWELNKRLIKEYGL